MGVIKRLAVVAMTAAISVAATADDTPEENERRKESGSLEEWLELQRSGEAAGSRPTLGGEEMQRIYERYLDSFTHPIPERFRTED